MSQYTEFHCLAKEAWKEVPARTVGGTGNCYLGKDFIPDKDGNQTYEIRVFVSKIKK